MSSGPSANPAAVLGSWCCSGQVLDRLLSSAVVFVQGGCITLRRIVSRSLFEDDRGTLFSSLPLQTGYLRILLIANTPTSKGQGRSQLSETFSGALSRLRLCRTVCSFSAAVTKQTFESDAGRTNANTPTTQSEHLHQLKNILPNSPWRQSSFFTSSGML